jgi:hypothetical protein
MRRVLTAVALANVAVSTAPAQWAGMPAWNSPRGRPGIMMHIDVGVPNDGSGGGNAFGVRGTAGWRRWSLAAGICSWQPDGFTNRISAYAGALRFRVVGGSLTPLAVNILGGGGRTSDLAEPMMSREATTNAIAGAGAGVLLPFPGLNVEPYASLTNRWRWVDGSSETQSNVGLTLGANLDFGTLFGIHVAYDAESQGGTTASVFGISALIWLAPISR